MSRKSSLSTLPQNLPFFAIVPSSSFSQSILSICTIIVNSASFKDGIVGLVSSANSYGAGEGGKGCSYKQFYFLTDRES
jgi:hypothetical protein